jgi:hypothetical protein
MTNEALAKQYAEAYMAHQGTSGIMKELGGSFGAKQIQSSLESCEKEIVFMFVEMAFSYIKADIFLNEEAFENGFDRWLDDELANEIPDVQDLLFSITWKYVGGAVFSVFIPFLLLFVFIVLVPLVDKGIYNYRAKKKAARVIE